LTLKVENHVVELFSGGLVDGDGQSKDYQIFFGNSLKASLAADAQWSQWNYELLEVVDELVERDPTLKEATEQLNFEDSHWNWGRKSSFYSSNEYLWFYLVCDNRVQGICLVYQPKESKLATADIFYVEFIAVAPWNRSHEFNFRKFCGIGSLLLQSAIRYCVETLGLALGFSLHSLPQAESYYTKIGMTKIEGEEKDGLAFFEMPEDHCRELLGR
jgi:hypothetical protein